MNLEFALEWLWVCCDAVVYLRSFREERASQGAKMKITHLLAMSIFAGATLGSAATAMADDGLNGSYLFKLPSGTSGLWNFTTTCSPTCVAQVTLPDGNVHHANLANGQWTLE